MTHLSRAMIVLLALCMLLVGACKKSVEGEENAWKSNVAKVTELQAQYPGFEPALKARLATAQAVYDKAEGLADDAKIEQLSAANSALRKGFVGDLDDLDKKIEKLRKARVEATAKAGDKAVAEAAKLAAKDAEQTLDRVEKTLKDGAKDEAAADAVLKKVNADLKTAQAAIDKVLEVDKSKKDAAQAEKDAKADAETKAKTEAEEKVANWTCAYCGSSNPHDATKCSSCGAAREEKKTDQKPPQ